MTAVGKHSWRGFLLGIGIVLSTLGTQVAMASDHREAPGIADKPMLDIADFYAFLSPTSSNRLVLVMTVNGYSLPPAAKTYMFSDKARYKFYIDNDSDNRPDQSIVVTFSKPQFAHFSDPDHFSGQTFSASFGKGMPTLNGPVTAATQVYLVPSAPVIVEGANGVRMFAGLRDDPFFFDNVDSDRVFAGLQPKFTSTKDRFAGFNVSAIVIELPLSSVYRGKPLALWATTEELTPRGEWKQVQRVGHPAIKGVYVPDEMAELFNSTQPIDDVKNFKEPITESAQRLFHLSGDNLTTLVNLIVPDTLKLDPTKPIKMPNGRTLDDPLGNMFWFNLYTPIAYAPGDLDGVHGNDVPNSKYFPYLAAPHTVPR